LGELYIRVVSRKGSGRAAVRVANKLAVVIWFMLTEGRGYDQVREGLYRSKLKRVRRAAS